MIEEMQRISVEYRKEKNPLAGVLVTLVSEIKMRAKNDGNREAADQDATKVLQSFLKNAQETRTALVSAGKDTSQIDAEIELFENFLPETISPEKTLEIVEQAISDAGAETPKDIGKVMGLLKNINGLDMRLASSAAKELLNG